MPHETRGALNVVAYSRRRLLRTGRYCTPEEGRGERKEEKVVVYIRWEDMTKEQRTIEQSTSEQSIS